MRTDSAAEPGARGRTQRVEAEEDESRSMPTPTSGAMERHRHVASPVAALGVPAAFGVLEGVPACVAVLGAAARGVEAFAAGFFNKEGLLSEPVGARFSAFTGAGGFSPSLVCARVGAWLACECA